MESIDGEPYKVRQGPLRIPIAKREVSRVAVSPSHVTLELISTGDPLTSRVEFFAIDSVDLGTAAGKPHHILGSEAGILHGLLRRRVTACVATDGTLELRLTGSAKVRSGKWEVSFGDGRHWTPQEGNGTAEWRPGSWQAAWVRPSHRSPQSKERLDVAVPLPLAGQRLEAISFFDGRLDLEFRTEARTQPPRQIDHLPDVEVDFAGAVLFGAGRQVVEAGEPASAAPLLGLVGVATTGGSVSPDGTLEIRFANGATLAAGPGEAVGWGVSIEDGQWYGAVVRGEGRRGRPHRARGGPAARRFRARPSRPGIPRVLGDRPARPVLGVRPAQGPHHPRARRRL